MAGMHSAAQWLGLDEARRHCAAGTPVWPWASTGAGNDAPEVVLACAGGIPTAETPAAEQLLRRDLPDARVRIMNVVDLCSLAPPDRHPHGLADAGFEAVFDTDLPVVLDFHGYPSAVHQLLHGRPRPERFPVRGYVEEGTTTTPYDLLLSNGVSGHDLAITALEHLRGARRRPATWRCATPPNGPGRGRSCAARASIRRRSRGGVGSHEAVCRAAARRTQRPAAHRSSRTRTPRHRVLGVRCLVTVTTTLVDLTFREQTVTGNDSITSTTAQLEEELPRLEALQHALRGELEQVTVRLESVRGALTALGALASAPLPRPRAEPSAPAAPAESADADAVTPTPAAPAAPAPEAAAAEADAEAPAEAPEAASVESGTKAAEDEAAPAASVPAQTKRSGAAGSARTTTRAATGKAKATTGRKTTAKPAKPAKATKSAAPARSTKTAGAAATKKAATAGKTATDAKTAAEPAKPAKATKSAAPAKAAKAAEPTKAAESAAPAADQKDGTGLTEQVVAVLAARADTALRARDVTEALGRETTPGGINTVRSTLDRLVATSRAARAGRGLYQAPAN
ncbi:hypothetical protein [Streptomyces zhihengii]